jgi:hypothetical protein
VLVLMIDSIRGGGTTPGHLEGSLNEVRCHYWRTAGSIQMSRAVPLHVRLARSSGTHSVLLTGSLPLQTKSPAQMLGDASHTVAYNDSPR